MPQVSNLQIINESGTSNYRATWSFNEYTNSASTSSGTIKAGDKVSIKAGATWYNGVSIDSWVFNYQWYVLQVSGNRAVLDKSPDINKSIMSPINTKYLTGGSGSSSSTTSSTKTLEKYEVTWKYYTSNDMWFRGSTGDCESSPSDSYSPPDNALKISVTVKPISKTYEVKNSKGETDNKEYWIGSPVTVTFDMAQSRPNTPSKPPKPEVKDYTLTAKIEDITDVKTDEIEFQVYEGSNSYDTRSVTVLMASASYSWTIKPGCKYRYRCRAVNLYGSTKIYSDWSQYSEEVSSVPDAVTNVRCSADSKTSVFITWDESPAAKTYEVQYTNTLKYFDTTNEPQTTPPVEGTSTYVYGLETGHKWYFRVRAINESGESGWSDPIQAVIGTAPEAPTTWSLTNTVIIQENATIKLYWVHNSEDKSKQTEAEIRLDVNGMVEYISIDSSNSVNEDEEERIYSYEEDANKYGEGAKILWQVRTKGVVNEFSEWSAQRRIDLYAIPKVAVGISTDESGYITSFPININMRAGSAIQRPTSYHISIKNVDAYESKDIIGSEIMVSAGTELFSRIYAVTDNDYSVSLSAGDVLLENNQNYELTVTASMDSGLIAESTAPFSVNWASHEYLVDAFISIDNKTLSAYIAPYCADAEGNFPGDVTLGVYRRESNGTFTEIISGLANTGVDTITDPHPSLDYARYRIVAQNVKTSAVMYEDIPGHPIGEPSIIIQWDEKWVNFDYSDDLEPDVRPWTGSMLRLKYNVDINEKYSGDVSLIGYIGRDHPVSYYGTQRGESATWSTVIEKTDKETLYALRRLAAWRGDVYVREPSGTGYWAQITVSFPINHNELTIPVTFEINRVEGGV